MTPQAQPETFSDFFATDHVKRPRNRAKAWRGAFAYQPHNAAATSTHQRPEEPGSEFPVDVPDTPVEPPGTLPDAPKPTLPKPNVPAPAPVPAPHPPENEGVERVVEGLPINARLPGGE